MTRRDRKRLKQLRDKCRVLVHKGTGKFIGFHDDGDAHLRPYAHYDEDQYEFTGGTEAERTKYFQLYSEYMKEKVSKACDAARKKVADEFYGLTAWLPVYVSRDVETGICF